MATPRERSAKRITPLDRVEVKPHPVAESAPAASVPPLGVPGALDGVPHMSWLMGTLHAHIRLELLLGLKAGEACVGTLATALQREFSQVSTHLGDLTTEGLVVLRREGRHHFYRLAPGVSVTSQHNEVIITVVRGGWQTSITAARCAAAITAQRNGHVAS